MSKTMDLINSRGHKKEDEESLRFYQMPKILFKSEVYRKISLGARAMYSVLRDRQELSIKNNWTDEDGFYFLIYTIENLADELSISERTVSTYKRELAKAELLAEVRQGQGKPNRIYILKPNYDIEDTFIKKESYPQAIPVGNTKTRKNCKSRLEDIASQDTQKLLTNDTDVSEIDVSETHSFIQEKEGTNENIDNIVDANERKELQEIIDNSYSSDFKEKDTIDHAIKMLYYTDRFLKIDNMNVPTYEVRKNLKKIDYSVLEAALHDYKLAAKENKIKYPVKYFSKCLYHSIINYDFKLTSEVMGDGLIQ